MKKVIIIAVVILVIGVAAYFLLFKKEETESEINSLSPEHNNNAARSVTAPIVTLPTTQKKVNQTLISNILASKS